MKKKLINKKLTGSVKRCLAAAAAVICLAALSACGGQEASAESGSVKESGTEAAAGVSADASAEKYVPEITPFEDIFRSFSLKDTEGNEVTEAVLSDHELTMINVWATFCNPCLKEMPDLGALNREYQEDGKSFQIIGLVMDGFRVEESGEIVEDPDMTETARSMIDQTGADYLHLIPTGDFAYSLVASGQTQSVPTTLFVDSEGNMIGKPVVGSRSGENWKVIIDEKLADLGA